LGIRPRGLAKPMFVHRAKLKPEGFGPNSPGPLVEPHVLQMRPIRPGGFESWLVCFCKPTAGFRLAANHFVRRRRPMDKHRPRHLPRELSRHPKNRTASIKTGKALVEIESSTYERFCIFMMRAFEYIIGVALLDDFAVLHHHHIIRHSFDNCKIVADEDIGQAML
jgi:hypothetical protein